MTNVFVGNLASNGTQDEFPVLMSDKSMLSVRIRVLNCSAKSVLSMNRILT
jgi:hypothetical protein